MASYHTTGGIEWNTSKHVVSIEWIKGAKWSAKHVHFTNCIAHTTAPNLKMEAPSLPPRTTKPCTIVTVTIGGTCQPTKELLVAALETAVEGFDPGFEASAGGMVPRCGEE